VRLAGRRTDQNCAAAMRLQLVEPATEGRFTLLGDRSIYHPRQPADLQLIECVSERIDLGEERKWTRIAVAGRFVLDIVDEQCIHGQ